MHNDVFSFDISVILKKCLSIYLGLTRNQHSFCLIFLIPLNILKKSLANVQRLICMFSEAFHCIMRKQRKNYEALSAFCFPS